MVTVDAQLFYTVLQALPYLVDYPYECTEQTLNRFVSTGIVSSLFEQLPGGREDGAGALASATTPLETWDAADPEPQDGARGDALARASRGAARTPGGRTASTCSTRRVARAERDVGAGEAAQGADVAAARFPWLPGGPPSPYMTLYILYGLREGGGVRRRRAEGHGRSAAGSTWPGTSARSTPRRMTKDDCCWEFLTFLNYVARGYPDASLDGRRADRRRAQGRSSTSRFKHWKQHSPVPEGATWR